MAIITIARELGAWDTATSQLLAQKFNGVLFDRSVIKDQMQSAGVSVEIIDRYDERKPGFFSALSADQDVYLLYLKSILLTAAQRSPLIVLGRCAHMLLEDIPGCLRIRLIAPEEIRVKRIADEFRCDEETARHMMRKCDADRAGFCRFHFNSDWADPGCYDVVINTAKLSSQALVEQLLWLGGHYFTPEEEAAAGAVIARKLLAQQVITRIQVDRKLSLAFIEADVDEGGVVTLRGASSSHETVAAAVKAAGEVPGITGVKNSLRVSIELSHTRI